MLCKHHCYLLIYTLNQKTFFSFTFTNNHSYRLIDFCLTNILYVLSLLLATFIPLTSSLYKTSPLPTSIICSSHLFPSLHITMVYYIICSSPLFPVPNKKRHQSLLHHLFLSPIPITTHYHSLLHHMFLSPVPNTTHYPSLYLLFLSPVPNKKHHHPFVPEDSSLYLVESNLILPIT